MPNSVLKTADSLPYSLKRPGGKPTLDQTWPTRYQWNKRNRAIGAERLRRLGLDPRQAAENGLPASQVLSVLGADSFAEFAAVNTTGRVLWCNFELAKYLGFGVPRSNTLTPEFLAQIQTLSLRALSPREEITNRQSITMYADKYGGDGLGPALGAGRAGFLPYGNLYIKGIGFTPLFRHNDEDDFAHSHGGVHLDDCLVEAVFGEVNENLFSRGSSRILAIIDQGKFVTDPHGRRIAIGIAVRTGAQLRPGHLQVRLRSKQSQLCRFIDITNASGQLIYQSAASIGVASPDIRATMLRIIDDHAATAAESFRWRTIHGALSASNMEISGAMLDLPTQSTQPRTAPIWLLEYANSSFGSEHDARATHLAPIYRKLQRNVPETEWAKFNIGPIHFRSEMHEAYGKHLQLQLLTAVGLKKELAQRIHRNHAQLASDFAALVVEMATLKNRGALGVSRATVEQVAILDVFNLLACIPTPFFAKPAGDHRTTILQYLKPIFRGNRFQVARKRLTVDGLVERFARLYRTLMSESRAHARELCGSTRNMEASITARAAFENQPLTCLYSHKLFRELRQAIKNYKSTGDPEVISKALDERITASLRSVDALLGQGDTRFLRDGGIELEMRTVDGVNYSVRAWNDEAQTRVVRVGVQVEPDEPRYLTSLPGLPRLTTRQLESLRFSFTTDSWETSRTIKGRLVEDEATGLVMSFDIPFGPYFVGRLDGRLCLKARAKPNTEYRHDIHGYVFAIPDRQELTSMVTRTSSS